MQKRLLSLLALLMALAMVAAACGDDDDEAADTTETTEGTTDTTEEETTTTEAESTTTEAETTTSEEAMEDGGDTVVDVAVASGEFPTLVAALEATGLDEVLAGEGPFTVFAPTEAAFADALAALGVSAEELLADPGLSDILTYHVLPIEAPAETVLTLDGEDVETVNGATVAISVDGDAVMVNDANVVQTDIEASNGVIHVIDAVLLPPES